MTPSDSNHGEPSVAYHLRELEIATDPLNPHHLMPRIQPHHNTILDIGCGLGQTLLAARLSPSVTAYGVDPDIDAIRAGQAMAPSNVHLEVGCGEALPFPDEMFDLVICRVALPYMRIARSLTETRRVLKAGGQVWMSLHGIETLRSRVRDSCAEGDVKDVAYCGFVGLNSALFLLVGAQMKLAGRTETVQTERGMRRAFARARLECTEVRRGRHFVVCGRKPATGAV